MKPLTDFVIDRGKIFSNMNVLRETYIPDNFFFRDDEMKRIKNDLSYFLEKGYMNHLFIFGPPSTGKTHIIKRLTENFNNIAEEYKINRKIIYFNFGGITYGEALREIATALNAKKSSLYDLQYTADKMEAALVFDEMDKMKKTIHEKNPADRLIHFFTRNTSLRLIVIVNDIMFPETLDITTRSTFSPNSIFFREYTASELFEILRSRCKLAFKEEVIDEEVISRFSAWIKSHGIELRIAFKILLEAGKLAEEKGMDHITFSNLEDAYKVVEFRMITDLIKKLNDNELLFLFSVAKAQEINFWKSAEKELVYKVYLDRCAKIGYSPSSWIYLQNFVVNKLRSMGFINLEKKGKGRGKGTITYYSLSIPIDETLPILEKMINEIKIV